MRVRAGLVTAIYKKALVLSSDERGRATGDIVNLMSVDATRMQDLCTYGLIAISGPYQVRGFTHFAFEVLTCHPEIRSPLHSSLFTICLAGPRLSVLVLWSFPSP